MMKRNRDILRNTKGAAGTEQVLVILTVGLLGIGGFQVLGGAMQTDIGTDARSGGVATSRQAGTGGGVVVSGQAGTGDYATTPTTLYVDPTAPVGPSAAAKAAAIIAKSFKNASGPELHFGHKRHGSGESFLGGLKRTALNLYNGRGVGSLDWLLPGHGTRIDDIYRGVVTAQHDIVDAILPDAIMNPMDRGLGLLGSLVDRALPGDGLLPGDILDGILPGHGFLGDDGFLTINKRFYQEVGSRFADAFGWNDDVNAQAELKKFKVADAYDLTKFNSNAAFNRLNDIYTNVIQNPDATPEQIAAALLSIDGILNGNPRKSSKTS